MAWQGIIWYEIYLVGARTPNHGTQNKLTIMFSFFVLNVQWQFFLHVYTYILIAHITQVSSPDTCTSGRYVTISHVKDISKGVVKRVHINIAHLSGVAASRNKNSMALMWRTFYALWYGRNIMKREQLVILAAIWIDVQHKSLRLHFNLLA